jgi:hypothetical protein
MRSCEQWPSWNGMDGPDPQAREKGGLGSMLQAGSALAAILSRPIWKCIACVLVFHMVAFSWIFFRARDLASARAYIRRLTSLNIEPFPFTFGQITGMIASILLLLLLVDLPQYLTRSHTALMRWPLVLRVAAVAVLLLSLLLNRGNHDVAFIYFQF